MQRFWSLTTKIFFKHLSIMFWIGWLPLYKKMKLSLSISSFNATKSEMLNKKLHFLCALRAVRFNPWKNLLRLKHIIKISRIIVHKQGCIKPKLDRCSAKRFWMDIPKWKSKTKKKKTYSSLRGVWGKFIVNQHFEIKHFSYSFHSFL